MKLPDVLAGLLPKKEETKEYFFSLYLDIDAAAVAVWHMDAGSIPKVSSFAHAVVADDTWESRIHVVDRLLSAAEDKVGVTKAITKTVFGLPGAYLTAEGNITDPVRLSLKKLSHMLELKPVGFVPLSQAIAFFLKKEEGIPPSIILVGCSGVRARVSLYRVGQLTHDEEILWGDDPAAALEGVLKAQQDGDVLPSRILLYGGNATIVEDVRSKLLKHAWPTRANFLHFPKIESLPVETLLAAVSLAGAAELAHEIGENPEESTVSTVVAQPTASGKKQTVTAGTISVAAEEEPGEELQEEDEEETSGDSEDGQEREEEDEPLEDEEEASDGEESREPAIAEYGSGSVELADEETSNVEVVTPESLGFRREDVLEHQHGPQKEMSHVHPGKVRASAFAFPMAFKFPKLQMPAFAWFRSGSSPAFRLRGSAPLIVGIIGTVIISSVLYFVLPRVTVTVLVASNSVDESMTVTVNPNATVADANTKMIPGKIQEQSVSGDKTITVTGKKNIGDPAKGTVTIYNKVTSGKTLPKGSVLTTGTIAFTLDSDVSIASASESIGSITFGKATANVTAKEIGPNGNVPSGSEFTFSSVSGTSVSARNEAAFTGGTSKQVTVVSRADQDALVKALTEDLLMKAKQQLLSGGSTGERLIESTIKTEVTEKIFDAELDQEARELHGKVTVRVSGISIADSDIKSVLLSQVEAKVPSGYRLAPEQTTVSTSNVQVKKDGSISLVVKLSAVSLPVIDGESLRSKLAGKKVQDATGILRETPGVAGAEYRFSLSPTKSRLPINRSNITVTVMVQ